MMDDLLAHRTEQKAGETSPSAASDHGEESIPRRLKDGMGRLIFHRLAFYEDRRLRLVGKGDRLTNDSFRLPTIAVEQIRGHTDAEHDSGREVPGTHDAKLGPPESSLVYREFYGTQRMLGAVHTYQYGLHYPSRLSLVTRELHPIGFLPRVVSP
jgi:hypothetical protein